MGVRDYFSQTQEYGANWYEGESTECPPLIASTKEKISGTYGYKTGWSIPVVQSVGVEGGGGTQVSRCSLPRKLFQMHSALIVRHEELDSCRAPL